MFKLRHDKTKIIKVDWKMKIFQGFLEGKLWALRF